MPSGHRRRALLVSVCARLLALVPGVSRSGATIVGGMLMRLDRPAAAEFSFFLAMPTMTAAFVHELVDVRAFLGPDRAIGDRHRLRDGLRLGGGRGQAVSRLVRRSGFAPFAWYRIAVGLVLLRDASAG